MKIIYRDRQEGKTTLLLQSCLLDPKGVFVVCLGEQREVKRIKEECLRIFHSNKPQVMQDMKNQLYAKIIHINDIEKKLAGKGDVNLYIDNIEFVLEKIITSHFHLHGCRVPLVTISHEYSPLDIILEERKNTK